jgi:hypothetical protein
VLLVARRAASSNRQGRDAESSSGRAACIACDYRSRRSPVRGARGSFLVHPTFWCRPPVNIRSRCSDHHADWDASLKLNLDAPFFLAQRLR